MAALTVYDMIKAVEKTGRIQNIRLASSAFHGLLVAPGDPEALRSAVARLRVGTPVDEAAPPADDA